jgi:hypothetical protein
MRLQKLTMQPQNSALPLAKLNVSLGFQEFRSQVSWLIKLARLRVMTRHVEGLFFPQPSTLNPRPSAQPEAGLKPVLPEMTHQGLVGPCITHNFETGNHTLTRL